MPTAFAAGDTVKLASGGPTMTVELVEGSTTYCVWFDSHDTLQRNNFPAAALVAAP